MKIWCDVCTKKEASVFCSADEAALCEECDLRVHQANKLASKHQRFSLLQPSQVPHCDICQEKKALLFCQQDRAILCRECDVPIHTSSELTKKHDRFLLTGAKLSGITKTKSSGGFDQVPDFRCKSLTTKRPCLFPSNTHLSFKPQATNEVAVTQEEKNYGHEEGSSSSISEYLIEMLPGWQVEDLLLDSSSDLVGLSRGGHHDLLDDTNEARFSGYINNDNYNNDINYYNNAAFWVPQAPTVLQPSPFNPAGLSVLKGAEVAKGDPLVGLKRTSVSMIDDGFTVPQVRPQSLGSKTYI